MSSPPISKPTALTKSETATAFNPPKIAYAIPIIPIDQTQILIVADSEIPKTLGKSNIVLNASEPDTKSLEAIQFQRLLEIKLTAVPLFVGQIDIL